MLTSKNPTCLILALILLLPAYLCLHHEGWRLREQSRLNTHQGYVIPSKYARIMAGEHQGIVSDYLLLKVITFFGEKVVHNKQMKDNDWNYIISSFDVITDLDPAFLDPYVLAESLLTWDAGRVDDANRLLRKGLKHRKDDWQFPFYIGFNYFYFLKEPDLAADYLMMASRLPDSPSFLPTLASRLGYYGGNTSTATVFLRGLIAQTTEKSIRTSMIMRLKALETAALLEELVAKYKSEYGMSPTQIKDLISAGYLEKLPPDPYGGNWILLETGRVYSTSRFLQMSNFDDTQ